MCFIIPFNIVFTLLGEEGVGLCASHAFVCLFCMCSFLSFFSSSWCQQLAAVCDCGIPWTFLLTLMHQKAWQMVLSGLFKRSKGDPSSPHLRFQQGWCTSLTRVTYCQAWINYHVYKIQEWYVSNPQFFINHPVLPHLVLFVETEPSGAIPIQHLPPCGVGNEAVQPSIILCCFGGLNHPGLPQISVDVWPYAIPLCPSLNQSVTGSEPKDAAINHYSPTWKCCE